MQTILKSFLLLVTASLAHSTIDAADWRQFRGPNGGAVASEGEIPKALKIDWSAELPGRGLACPIVVGDKVFVTCASGPSQERLHLFCFSAADGKKIWERQLKATGRTMTQNKTCVAAPSPCSDGTHVYAIWSCNDLAAFDLDGNLLWLRGLTADYPNVSNSLGMAASLLTINGAVVVPVENDSESYTLGIDAKTGTNLWKMDRPKAANWSTPIVFHPKGSAAPAVLLQSKEGLTAVDANTGSPLWNYSEGASTMSSSVVVGSMVLAASHGITALEPQPNGAQPKQLWRIEQMNPATASPIAVNGHIYAINGAGVLVQATLADGGRGFKLRLKGPFSGSPVAAGDRIAVVNEKGLVQVVDTTAPEGAVINELQLPLKEKELVLSTPAVSGDHVFIRGDSALWRLGK
jgi:outer membrane protein assembly factor BamB